jgi:hypothetical protein
MRTLAGSTAKPSVFCVGFALNREVNLNLTSSGNMWSTARTIAAGDVVIVWMVRNLKINLRFTDKITHRQGKA